SFRLQILSMVARPNRWAPRWERLCSERLCSERLCPERLCPELPCSELPCSEVGVPPRSGPWEETLPASRARSVPRSAEKGQKPQPKKGAKSQKEFLILEQN